MTQFKVFWKLLNAPYINLSQMRDYICNYSAMCYKSIIYHHNGEDLR